MRADDARAELAKLAEQLAELTKETEGTGRALQAAKERLDAIDPDQWHGRPTGALAAALEAVGEAEGDHRRTTAALAANHRRRLELVTMLRAAVAAA